MSRQRSSDPLTPTPHPIRRVVRAVAAVVLGRSPATHPAPSAPTSPIRLDRLNPEQRARLASNLQRLVRPKDPTPARSRS